MKIENGKMTVTSSFVSYSLPDTIKRDEYCTLQATVSTADAAGETSDIFIGVHDPIVTPGGAYGRTYTGVGPGVTLDCSIELIPEVWYTENGKVLGDHVDWKLMTGYKVDPTTFEKTDETPSKRIPVIKPMGITPWIALGAAAIGVAAVGIVSYKKWG